MAVRIVGPDSAAQPPLLGCALLGVSRQVYLRKPRTFMPSRYSDQVSKCLPHTLRSHILAKLNARHSHSTIKA